MTIQRICEARVAFERAESPGRARLPRDELLCRSGAHLHHGGLLLRGQIHGLLRVEMRPQRMLVVLQLVLPRLQHPKIPHSYYLKPFRSFPPSPPSHPVSGEHLGSVLVLDLDDAGRLDPGLAVHLDGNSLIPQDVCFNGPAHLCDAVVLQLDDPGHSHLHAPEHGYHLQDLIVLCRSSFVPRTPYHIMFLVRLLRGRQQRLHVWFSVAQQTQGGDI
ncbi:hypothetical protein EYF80_010746 [Liparis tanakae]|uniref:Uncharacterized protein n=1 Tax=Liparis tanakae TaxID=230148 RepID=A0A4Z2IMR7_9TELE|nr:hypothetical protein EYF80_010746 [Liparis tanakae]